MKEYNKNTPIRVCDSSYEIIGDTEPPLMYKQRLVLMDENPIRRFSNAIRDNYRIYYELQDKFGWKKSWQELKDNSPACNFNKIEQDRLLGFCDGINDYNVALKVFRKICENRGLTPNDLNPNYRPR